MNPIEIEIAKRALKNSKEARLFIPFYRNILRPILDHSITEVLSGDRVLTDEDLRMTRAFARVARDMEIILTRIIIKGESVERALEKTLIKERRESNVENN